MGESRVNRDRALQIAADLEDDQLLRRLRSDAAHDESSRAWLDDALSGSDTVAFAWVALLAFVRLSTKVGLFPAPLTVDESMDRVDAWVGAAPAVVVADPSMTSQLILSCGS